MFASLALVVSSFAFAQHGSPDEPSVAGEVRLARSGCVNCHAGRAMEREPGPSLERAGASFDPAFLRKWLAAPHAVKPGTPMPDLVSPLPAEERERALDELVAFLCSRGGPFEEPTRAFDASELERGRRLYHSVGCVPCHAPQESVVDLEAPIWDLALDTALAPHVATSFPDPATKWSVDELAKFLREPLERHPAGRMPSLALDAGEARAIALYLCRSAVAEVVERPGLAFEYFEEPFASAPRGFQGAKSVRSGVIADFETLPEHADDSFGFQFTGLLEVTEAGVHRFTLRSDDGSRLWLDGKQVIDNDGQHAPQAKSGEVWLAKGRHELCVTFFESAGGEELAVRWQPPNGAEAPLPAERLAHWELEARPREVPRAAPDPALVARGRERFGALGCVRCHELEGVVDSASKPGDLRAIAAHADRGCLAEVPPPTVPHYAFDARARDELRAALPLVGDPQRGVDDARRIAVLLADSNCFACHARSGRGGPDETNQGYFRALVDADLGNEGRFPPALDGVGAKLHAAWIEKVLAGRGVERPYLATRMPVFGERRVAELPRLFAAVDAHDVAPKSPPFDEALAEVGRKLAGEKGLACIQCHSFNGTKSLGIPAVDLGHVVERIRPEWFEKLLLDPKSVGMNSRMSTFWVEDAGKLTSPVKDVLDADPRRQIDALWQYVSLGRSMPLPDGLVVAKTQYEVEVGREPRIVGVFFAGASPRTMLVGFPERTHLAFDVEHSRLVAAWRGHFFSGEGTWLGRAGGLEKPQGESVLEFPRRAPFAWLAQPGDPWPNELGEDAGYRVLGWKRDAVGRPVFRYALGDVVIEELDHPLLSPGSARLRRVFELRAPRPVSDLVFAVAGPSGTAADEVASGLGGVLPGATDEVRFGDESSVRSVAARSKFYRVVDGDELEARLPIVFEPQGESFVARFEVEVSW
ncbi:MAG: PA14 domain-containing protein [Planctomycetes bacterium]|nr:PA14 domain-containing protein [Planctomycetota bacterium]